MKKAIVAAATAFSIARRLFATKSKAELQKTPTTHPEPQSNLSTRQERREEIVEGRGQRRRQEAQQVKQGGWWRSFKTILNYKKTWIGLVASLLSIYLFFAPRLSVDTVDAIDPKDIFSTPFIIKNDGFLPTTNVRVDCLYHKMIDQNNSTWINNKYQGRDSRDIGVNRSIGAKCSLGQGIAPLKEADMSITLSYQLWPISWTKTETWPYKVIRGPDGKLNWIPVSGRKT